MSLRALVLTAAGGLLIGLAGFTFHYGEGTSYFSKDPGACINCHIMQPQYDAWQKASHKAVAGCVDCHLPAHGLHKWTAKARNGFEHSWGFTFQDFHEPIVIKEPNARILQDNCVRCHQDLVHDVLDPGADPSAVMRCVHCHRSVGHGEQAGLGGYDHSIHNQKESP